MCLSILVCNLNCSFPEQVKLSYPCLVACQVRCQYLTNYCFLPRIFFLPDSWSLRTAQPQEFSPAANQQSPEKANKHSEESSSLSCFWKQKQRQKQRKKNIQIIATSLKSSFLPLLILASKNYGSLASRPISLASLPTHGCGLKGQGTRRLQTCSGGLFSALPPGHFNFSPFFYRNIFSFNSTKQRQMNGWSGT